MARLNGYTKWVSIGITLLVLFAAAIAGFTSNKFGIADNAIEITENKIECRATAKAQSARIKVVEDAMIEQKTDLKWIRQRLEKMEP